jgi:hypothetical protein
LPDDDSLVPLSEVRGEICMLGKAVVPAYELAGRVDALQSLPGNPEMPILGCTVREDDGIVVAEDTGQRDCTAIRMVGLGADRDVANEGKIRRGGHFLEFLLAVLSKSSATLD